MNVISFFNLLLIIGTAPLLLSFVNRTKAYFAGRQGPSLLQPYFDVWRLLNKGAVFSDVTSWVFRLAPTLNLVTILMALGLVPIFGFPSQLILKAILSFWAVCWVWVDLLWSSQRWIPVDDPNTHLELTMVHEVMVLDHSGPDLAFIEIAKYLKFALYNFFIVGLLGSFIAGPLLKIAVGLLVSFLISLAVGCIESTMARLRMNKAPILIALAGVFTFLGIVIGII